MFQILHQFSLSLGAIVLLFAAVMSIGLAVHIAFFTAQDRSILLSIGFVVTGIGAGLAGISELSIVDKYPEKLVGYLLLVGFIILIVGILIRKKKLEIRFPRQLKIAMSVCGTIAAVCIIALIVLLRNR